MSYYGKRFGHKIYDVNGVFLGTLSPRIVTNLPNFTWKINGGMGEMLIHLAIDLKTFVESYENTIIKLGNEVRTMITDPTTAPMQIFDGYITTYEPSMSEDGHQEVIVHVTSTSKTLYDQLMKNGGSTSRTFTTTDPSVMIKAFLDGLAGTVHYTGGTITDTLTTVTYAFSYLSYGEAVDIALSLCPAFWYYYIDANNIFYLKSTDFDTVNHKLFIGKEVDSINASKSIEELFNAIYFKGGGATPLYTSDSRGASIAEYGRFEYKMQDERVTIQATASRMMTKFLDEHDHPRSILTATILDNSVDTNKGYDIESLMPGQMLQIVHPRVEQKFSLWDIAEWDVDYWDFNIIYSLSLPMQIIEIDYQFTKAIVKLSLVAIDIAQQIDQLQTSLDTVRQEGIPSTPS